MPPPFVPAGAARRAASADGCAADGHRQVEEGQRPDGVLIDRERDVFTLIGQGLSNTEIAGAMNLSTGTVKPYVHDILAKLGLRDLVQAVVLAFETGLVRPAGRR